MIIYILLWFGHILPSKVQSPLSIATLDIAAALPIATSSPVTNLRQYINSDLGYNNLNFSLSCSKIATVISFEVAISNALSFYRLNFTFFYQMSFGNSDRAAYSDLNPRDGGQSLYPMSTVLMASSKASLFSNQKPVYYKATCFRHPWRPLNQQLLSVGC